MQAVAACGGRNEPITGGYLPACFLGGCCDFPPDAACLKIDGEDPVCVVLFNDLEPGLKRTLVRALPDKSYPFGNFTNGNDADKEIFVIDRLDSLTDADIALGPAQFGEDTRIQKGFQNFTFRMGERSRVRLSPWKLGPLPSRKCLKLGFLPVSFS